MKNTKKQILVMFGGNAPEHEVSIITGLQVVESVDREKYDVGVIYVTKEGHFKYIDDFKTKKNFLNSKQTPAYFSSDKKGGYLVVESIIKKKIYPHAVYLAFHGGEGENGGIAGLLDTFGIAYTSSSYEGLVLCMNKQVTKDIVHSSGVNVVPGLSLFSKDIKKDSQNCAKLIYDKLSLPVIIKPVHLGSSIGIKIAKNETELERFLLEASYVDSEILVEQFLSKPTEYNISVRTVNGEIELSEIEKPLSHDEILSFADKYQKGAKKTGGEGMVSLSRDLPAKISKDLKEIIESQAKKAYIACRCKGIVRIDFITSDNKTIYLEEINPIPGSMSFYLWEASGVSFKEQITVMIEEAAVATKLKRSMRLEYKSDIVEKFVGQNSTL